MDRRRKELQYHARLARLKWISSAAISSPTSFRSEPVLSEDSNLPAAECLQQILNYLTESAGDNEVISVESLVSNYDLTCEAEKEIKLPTFPEGMDPYFIFIEKLKHPIANDIVKSLYAFVGKIESSMKTYKSNNAGLITDSQHETQAENIRNYHKKITKQMKENSLWSCESSDEWEHTLDSVERFIFTKLYDTLTNTGICIYIINYIN